MYVVTRTFRDSNGVFSVGSVVEPTEVKTFKSRLQQKHIVDVSERNIDKWVSFFRNRYGLDLSDKLKEYITENSAETPAVEAPQVSTKPAKPTKPVDNVAKNATLEKQADKQKTTDW